MTPLDLASPISPEAWSRLPGRLVVVSGPSGVGKTTLVHKLIERCGGRASQSISATTRTPRSGEREGIDYYFVPREAFLAARDRGVFLEWAEVHDALYGTPAGPVLQRLAAGDWVFLVIDVQGGRQVHEQVPSALLVWIEPPSAASLEARLRRAGPPTAKPGSVRGSRPPAARPNWPVGSIRRN